MINIFKGNVQVSHLNTVFETIALIFIVWLICKLLIYINTKYNKNEKIIYIINKGLKLFRLFAILFIFLFLWKEDINNVFTIIGITSATIALALKDVLFNLFAGFYIKSSKPFKVEDRIEIDGTIGDVININLCSFNLLEVGDKDQSTGIIIEIPNSFVFSKKIKNYTKAIKYVWSEIYVKVNLDSDLEKTKKILYSIINKNEVVKTIPSKMKKEMKEAMKDYRIYYNHLEPIIYTNVVDDYVMLSIRYLVHPKKKRFVESQIWNQIILESKKGNILIHK